MGEEKEPSLKKNRDWSDLASPRQRAHWQRSFKVERLSPPPPKRSLDRALAPKVGPPCRLQQGEPLPAQVPSGPPPLPPEYLTPLHRTAAAR